MSTEHMPRPSRLTVVETVYHECGDDPPVSSESRFSRDLPSGEQHYNRKVTVASANWIPLNFGWAGPTPAHVVIQNDENRYGPPTTPTPEEAARLTSLVLELGVLGGMGVVPVAKVRPGESARLEPHHDGKLYVRAPNGRVHAVVFAVPGKGENDHA